MAVVEIPNQCRVRDLEAAASLLDRDYAAVANLLLDAAAVIRGKKLDRRKGIPCCIGAAHGAFCTCPE